MKYCGLFERVAGLLEERLCEALRCIDRGLEADVNDGVLIAWCIEVQLWGIRGRGWAREEVVQVRRGRRKRGISVTGLEPAMGGIAKMYYCFEG